MQFKHEMQGTTDEMNLVPTVWQHFRRGSGKKSIKINFAIDDEKIKGGKAEKMVLFLFPDFLRSIIFIYNIFKNLFDRKTYINSFFYFTSLSSEMLPYGKDQIHFVRLPLPLLHAIHDYLSLG